MAAWAVDTCYDERTETIDSVIAAFSAEFGVTGKVLVAVGPAGGWPVVEWEGEKDALARLANAHYNAGADISLDSWELSEVHEGFPA